MFQTTNQYWSTIWGFQPKRPWTSFFWGCSSWHCVFPASIQTYHSPKLPAEKRRRKSINNKKSNNIKNPQIQKSLSLIPTFCNHVAFKCKMWGNPLYLLGNAVKSTKTPGKRKHLEISRLCMLQDYSYETMARDAFHFWKASSITHAPTSTIQHHATLQAVAAVAGQGL